MATDGSINLRGANSIRTATLSDLDNVVDVVRSAMPLDPQWNYRFEHGRQFPEDNVKYTRLLFENFIMPDYDDWHVMVAESPGEEPSHQSKIVAFAVWDVSYRNKRKNGRGYVPQNPMLRVAKAGGADRRDVNPKRQAVFREAGSKGKQTLFDDVYGPNQIHLQILGTHPDYMRRGYGSALVYWGIAVAKANNLAVSLMASPMGIPLYTHLGFKHVKRIILRVPEETEEVYIDAMVLEGVNQEKLRMKI
ncbi:MAG: hypothetical protein Q9195_005492 [Heterodermia aff. obscurata]